MESRNGPSAYCTALWAIIDCPLSNRVINQHPVRGRWLSAVCSDSVAGLFCLKNDSQLEIRMQSADRSADKAREQLLERKRKEEKQRRDKAKQKGGDDEAEGFAGAVAEEEDELLCDPDFTFVKKRERMPLEELRVRAIPSFHNM